MNRIDGNNIPDNKDEVRLFMVGIDAAELIPHVFRHYFDIGVGRIFYIDNNSTDNSLEVLTGQDRVHVWTQADIFSGYGTPAKSGAAWIESLMLNYGVDNWCLLADTDELFVYPGYKDISIYDFVTRLDGDCITADFIDMYSNKKVSDTVIEGSLLETCPFTDKSGNCRERVLGFRPNLIKMPLFRFTQAISVGAGFHGVSGYNRMASVRCSVLHFKFLSGLSVRLGRHGHKMSGSDIKAVAYKDIGEVNFYDDDVSVRLEE